MVDYQYMYDVFIAHASEDKESFVRPLAKALTKLGMSVWFDESSLKIGDSLSRSIDKGLAASRYGLVIVSHAFIAKAWPEYELRGLVTRELAAGRKLILPIWHGIKASDVLEFSPTLADKYALNTSYLDAEAIALQLLQEIRPDIYEARTLAEWRQIASGDALDDLSTEIESARHGFAILHARDAYDLVTAIDIKSTLVARIENASGDVTYERWFRVVLLKNGVTIRKTKRDLVASEVRIDDFPPEANLIDAEPSNIQLTPADLSYSRVIRDGRPHYDYWWCYDIVPHLRTKGDRLEYTYACKIPRCEAKAFSENGSLFFFQHESIPLEVKNSLIGPPNYEIVVLDAWVQDSERVRAEVSTTELPQLDATKTILSWNPTYRKGACFICKYRLMVVGSNVEEVA